MNRKIKFRVWDKQNKKFVTKIENSCHGEDEGYSTYNNIYIGLNGNLINNDTSGGWGGRETELNAENYIIQQFTGLKDCNNKEIYEGDIIDIGSRLGYCLVDKSESNPALVYTYLDKEHFGWEENFENIDAENIEIIGNIFENPELLK